MARYRERVKAPLKFHRNEDGTTDEYILYNSDGLKFFRAHRDEYQRNPSKRYISAELEVADITISRVEGGGHPTTNKIFRSTIANTWEAKVVQDQSMPSPRGFEINTSPASGDLFCEQIEDICGELVARKATCINLTDESKWIRPCGLHIHVDARDYTYLDLRRFIFIYEKIEPELFSMLPGYRRASHFAVPCGSVYARALREYRAYITKNRKKADSEKLKGSDIARHAIIQAAYGSREANRHDKRACPLATRYRSVNLHAYFFRGTLEFRHMYGTIDPEEIINWGILMALIVDYAFRLPESRLKTLGELSSEEALREIASKAEIWEFCQTQKARFSVPQQIRESPKLGEVDKESLWLYTSADVLLKPETQQPKEQTSSPSIGSDIGDTQGMSRAMRDMLTDDLNRMTSTIRRNMLSDVYWATPPLRVYRQVTEMERDSE